jgi:uncharacterized membrane protein
METKPFPDLPTDLSLPGQRKSWSWRGLLFGMLGLVVLIWLNNTPPGLLGKADALGYAVCHRIDSRSFHLGERALPLCARCSGMYLGFVTGWVWLGLTRPAAGGFPPRRIMVVLAGLGLLFAIDGLNSYVQLIPGIQGLYPPHNTLRLLTGSGVGLSLAMILFPAFNQTALAAYRAYAGVSNFRQLAGLLLAGMAVNLLVLWENSLVLYPLALISAGGVLFLLSLVYSMIGMMVFKAENRIRHPVQFVLPLAGGLLLALIQIALIDLIRYYLTGTWHGFTLG